jgi:hypothetical protein
MADARSSGRVAEAAPAEFGSGEVVRWRMVRSTYSFQASPVWTSFSRLLGFCLTNVAWGATMARSCGAYWGCFTHLLIAASLLGSPTITAGAMIRQTAVNPANNHIYHLLRGDTLGAGVTPVEAEAFAKTLGGHLVTINDFEEDLWVTSTFSEPYLYIGLNDMRQEGVFEWYSGEPVAYTSWYSGEPNNSGDVEDWVHIYNFSNGNWQWNDISNTSIIGGAPAYAVMEIVPEPSSLALLAAGALSGAVLRVRGQRWRIAHRNAVARLGSVGMFLSMVVVSNSRIDAATVVFAQNSPLPAEAGGNGVSLYSGTRDAHLREHGGMGTNQGGEPFLVIGQYADDEGDDTRILIDFEDYGTLPAYLQSEGLRIETATLRLSLRDATGTSPSTRQTLDVFRASSRFNEGTGASNQRDGRPALNGESTWSQKQWPDVPWAGGGPHSFADWLPDALDVGIVVNGNSSIGYLDFDVTGAFAADGSNLNGEHAGLTILARVDDENPFHDNTFGGKQFLFDSSESLESPPQLVFTLAPVPEPSSLVLLSAGAAGLAALRRRKHAVCGHD